MALGILSLLPSSLSASCFLLCLSRTFRDLVAFLRSSPLSKSVSISCRWYSGGEFEIGGIPCYDISGRLRSLVSVNHRRGSSSPVQADSR